jgi:hypothetical protein
MQPGRASGRPRQPLDRRSAAKSTGLPDPKCLQFTPFFYLCQGVSEVDLPFAGATAVTGRGSLSPNDIEPFDVFANRGKLRDSGNSARSAATSSNLGETDRRTAKLEFLSEQREDRDVQEIFDLLDLVVLLSDFGSLGSRSRATLWSPPGWRFEVGLTQSSSPPSSCRQCPTGRNREWSPAKRLLNAKVALGKVVVSLHRPWPICRELASAEFGRAENAQRAGVERGATLPTRCRRARQPAGSRPPVHSKIG